MDIEWNEGALIDQLRDGLRPSLEQAGKVMLKVFQDNVSRGPRSGVKRPGKYQSSAGKPIEFPQEQSGTYKEQADYWIADNGFEVRVGYSEDTLVRYFVKLEYKPAEDGGRRPLSRTANSDRLVSQLKARTDFS